MGMFSRFRRPQLDLDRDDFDDEVRAHLAIARDEKIADGMDERAAHYAALREFGNVTLTTEAARRVWTPSWLGLVRDVLSDVRYGGRSLRKNPAFSLAVVGVLTVGIGLNVAVFTMLKGIALSPVAGVADSASLVVVHGETGAGRPVRLSYPEYQEIKAHTQSIPDLFGSVVTKVNLGRGPAARQVWGEFVTGNYFEALGVGPTLGRTLGQADEAGPGERPVVVISEGLWRRDFASAPDIVGRTIEVNNRHLTVLGIADAAFHGTTVVYDVELYVPVTLAPDLGFTFGSSQSSAAGVLADRRAAILYPYGRVRPDLTNAAVEAELGGLWGKLRVLRPLDDPTERLRVVPFLDAPNGAPSYIMPTLVVLSAMGLLVLGITCANLAGLVLVRGVSRRGEIAVRLSLGASRSRIVRLLVVENLMLAVPGAVMGLALAWLGIPVLVGSAEQLAAPLRIYFNTDVDALVIGFALVIACGTVLLFGFLPALRTARVDLVTALNEDASPRGAGRSRVRAALVVAQVAVSVTLLAGAGLSARSLTAATAADPGFVSAGVSAVSFDLRQNGYDQSRGRIFQQRLLDTLRHDPSIASVSLAANTPLNMTETRVERITIEGRATPPGEDLGFMFNVVSPDYFRTLRVAVLEGREFTDQDDLGVEPVVIVNQTLATRYLGGPAAAIGRSIRMADGPSRRVVGVVADLKYLRIGDGPRPYFYLPLRQSYRSSLTLHTRSAGPNEDVEHARAAISRLDPDQPILAARSMTRATRGAFLFLDLTATMLLVFGAAGVVLASLGTYGLVSYAVRQSTHEIGIRMALGASAARVVRQFFARGLRLAAVGVVIGLVVALAAGRLLAGVLFGVGAVDGISLLQALVVVLASVVLATLVPAWRAAQTHPSSVLRHH